MHFDVLAGLSIAAILLALVTAQYIYMQRVHRRAYEKIAIHLNREKSNAEEIIEIAADIIISIGPDLTIKTFNQAAELAFGYTKAEALGSPLDILLPESITSVHHQYVTSFSKDAANQKWMGERASVQARRKDGSLFHAEASVSKYKAQGSFIFTILMRDVTDKLIAEKALLEKERTTAIAWESLTEALNTLSEGFAYFDADDCLILCNHVYRNIYFKDNVGFDFSAGTKFEDILRTGLKHGAYLDAIGREDEWLEERMTMHRTPSQSFAQQLSDGRWFLVNERRTSDGGYVGTRTDITALKNKESELTQSKSRFKDFAEAATDWLWEMDADLRFSFVSDATGRFPVDKYIGRTRKEILGWKHNDPRWGDHLERLEAHRPFKGFQYEMEAMEGKRLIVSIDGRPIFDEHNTFIGYRGVGQDITDQVIAENNLSASELRLRTILEASPYPLVVSKVSDGSILYANSQLHSLLGYSAHQFEGLRFPDSFVVEDECKKITGEIHANRSLQDREIRLTARNNKFIDTSMNAYLIELDETSVMISGVMDITERKQAARVITAHRDDLEVLVDERTREVQEQAALLEDALQVERKYSAMQQEFVSLVSHEFRTPLTIIDGMAQRMLRRKDNIAPDEVEERVSKIRTSVDRMTALIDKTLSASMIDSAGVKVARERCAIRNLINEICARHNDMSRTHTVQLDIEGVPREIICDPRLFDQIVSNLLSNAQKYSPGCSEIILNGWTEDNNLMISVEDYGLGIPSADMLKLFERFSVQRRLRAFRAQGLD